MGRQTSQYSLCTCMTLFTLHGFLKTLVTLVEGGEWGGGKLEVMASSPFGCAALSMTLHKVKINAPNPKSG